MGKKTLKLREGWTADIIIFNKKTGEHDISIYNTDPETGIKKFFEASTMNSLNGAPYFDQEPDLKIPVTVNDASYDVVGAVVLDENSIVTDRFSWSNLQFVQKKYFSIRDGQVIVDGESKGYIHTLVLPDKNRMRGYVAYCVPIAPEEIQIKELEDLALALLQ